MTNLDGSARLAVAGDDVITELFDEEMVVVDLQRGRYFSVELIGATIFELLRSGHDIDTVAATMAARFEPGTHDVGGEVARFAARLVEEGLLVPSTGTSAPPAPHTDPAGRAFAVPTLTAYDDMQDLLMLDPIHDVDDTGWPARPDTTR
jgi:hypothetical protein